MKTEIIEAVIGLYINNIDSKDLTVSFKIKEPLKDDFSNLDSLEWVGKIPKPKQVDLLNCLKKINEIKLKDNRELKLKEIDTACEKAIVSGFVSVALGSDHFYYSTIAEQSTLNSLINLGVPNNFKAQKINIVDEKEVKEERIQHLHTLEQLKEVLKDGAIHIATQVTKKDLLEEQIKAASTVEEIEAISWE